MKRDTPLAELTAHDWLVGNLLVAQAIRGDEPSPQKAELAARAIFVHYEREARARQKLDVGDLVRLAEGDGRDYYTDREGLGTVLETCEDDRHVYVRWERDHFAKSGEGSRYVPKYPLDLVTAAFEREDEPFPGKYAEGDMALVGPWKIGQGNALVAELHVGTRRYLRAIVLRNIDLVCGADFERPLSQEVDLFVSRGGYLWAFERGLRRMTSRLHLRIAPLAEVDPEARP